MKRWEMALLLALIFTLLLGMITSGGKVNHAQLPQQQMYCWWTVVYPEPEGWGCEAESGEYVLKCRVAEWWKQLCQKVNEKR